MTAKQGDYGGRKVREGTVVSDKMTQTVVVAVNADRAPKPLTLAVPSTFRHAHDLLDPGASIAARRALVGGWLDRGVPICSEDAGEDLADQDLAAIYELDGPAAT